MKLAQAPQVLSEFASIVVKTSSRCSAFTSSDVIHRVSWNPGSFGSILTDIRVKYRSLVVRRSGDDSGSLGRR